MKYRVEVVEFIKRYAIVDIEAQTIDQAEEEAREIHIPDQEWELTKPQARLVVRIIKKAPCTGCS